MCKNVAWQNSHDSNKQFYLENVVLAVAEVLQSAVDYDDGDDNYTVA